METQVKADPQLTAKRIEPAAAEKGSVAIYWWTAIGVFCILLNIWIFGNQYAAGHMHRIDPGPTPAPQWMQSGLFLNDIFWALALLVAIYFWMYRPWRQTGSISFWGKVSLAFL